MHNTLNGSERNLLVLLLLLVFGFGAVFALRANYEFLIYVGVILFALGLVAATRTRVDYRRDTLTGLVLWAALHLAGGGIVVGDGRLYDVMLWTVSDRLPVFRYDQLVHIVGFGTCTLLCADLLAPHWRDARLTFAKGLVLVMGGLGFGALNEIVEFIVDTSVPASGVGGYVNTSLDLYADLVGALLGLLWLRNIRPWFASRTRSGT